MSKIKGGYYIIARQIADSEISTRSPHIREVWHFLLKEANHEPKKVKGKIIERGQLLRTYEDIRNGLKWKVGFRTEHYNFDQISSAMKYLTRAKMITKTRTTRGLLITISNYDFYQTPENYESQRRTTGEPQREPSDKQEERKKKEKEKINKGKFHEFMTEEQLGNPEFLEKWNEWANYRKTEKRNSLTETSAKKQLKILANATDPIACIDNSLMNGYTGIFDNQKTNNRKTDGQKIREILADF